MQQIWYRITLTIEHENKTDLLEGSLLVFVSSKFPFRHSTISSFSFLCSVDSSVLSLWTVCFRSSNSVPISSIVTRRVAMTS
ncbi:hypothetical protein ACOMHN_062172 [Nucella lapillus]